MTPQPDRPSPSGGPAGPPPEGGGIGPVRVDTWLWTVRLAKTRSAATADCRAGHVRVNGKPVKAAQKVGPGDEIRLRRPGWERIVRVTRTLKSRVGAPAAREAYVDESPPPPPQLFSAPPRRDRGAGRPTKKDRRALDRLRSGIDEGDA